jgi:hypothetical protein
MPRILFPPQSAGVQSSSVAALSENELLERPLRHVVDVVRFGRAKPPSSSSGIAVRIKRRTV